MVSTAPRRTSTTFGPVEQVAAGVLDVGYVEAGPAGGPAVVLLHGWPYDVHSFAEVTPALAAAGRRVVVPFVRGYGTTRFLSDDAVRNAAAYAERFAGRYEHRVVTGGVGHNLPQEAPEAFSRAVLDVAG
jgi:pimeloyl-ACP methyl ester carboxylesterase